MIQKLPENQGFTLHLKRECIGSNWSNGGKIELMDRFSSLPDSILAHIFSFLPTDEAVASGVLSRRYKFLWEQVSVIDVSKNYFFRTNTSEKRIRFQNFVNNVLLLNKAPCLRFCRLNVPPEIDSRYANAWIEAIATREVKEMHLDVCCCVKLPFCVFEKLVGLKLKVICDLDMSSLHLPKLRVLSLSDVIDLNGRSLLRLLSSSCPVLQEFVVNNCWLSADSERKLLLCSSTIKKLKIQRMANAYVVGIDTPNLEYLMISIDHSVMYYASDLSSLKQADMCISNLCFSGHNAEVRTNNLKFINCLTSSSTLRIRRTQFEDIQERIYHLFPLFNNLTCLELEKYESCRCIVPAILERTPNLVTLIVTCTQNNDPDVEYSDIECSHVTHVPSCLLHSIKEIKIHDYDDTDASLEMIRYLLMNARVLKEMKVYWFSYIINHMYEGILLRELLSCARGSSIATVSLISIREYPYPEIT